MEEEEAKELSSPAGVEATAFAFAVDRLVSLLGSSGSAAAGVVELSPLARLPARGPSDSGCWESDSGWLRKEDVDAKGCC